LVISKIVEMAGCFCQLIESGSGVPIEAWTSGVPLELEGQEHLRNVAVLPIVYKWVGVMSDVPGYGGLRLEL